MLKKYFIEIRKKIYLFIIKTRYSLIRKIYEYCFFYDNKYFYLKYHESNSFQEYSKFFFEANVFKNIRAIFNYYNYLEKNMINAEALIILNEYFKSKNILEIKKINSNEPLYINNIVHKGIAENKLDITKKVSIILTVFNEGVLLSHSLQSLLNQSYKDIEIILVDDSSTDGTFEILQEFKSAYPDKIKLIKLYSNCGAYVAKNIGITCATGDLITFHDADDWAHPQRIEEHVKLHLQDQKVKFSISKLVRVTEDGYFYAKEIYPLDRLCMISLMIDKSLIEEIGYFRTYRLGSDTEYFERLKKFTTHKYERIDKVLMFCAHRQNSLTTSPQTGVEGFGKTNKRQHYWNQWHKWHDFLQKSKRKPHVIFYRSKYNYVTIE